MGWGGRAPAAHGVSGEGLTIDGCRGDHQRRTRHESWLWRVRRRRRLFLCACWLAREDGSPTRVRPDWRARHAGHGPARAAGSPVRPARQQWGIEVIRLQMQLPRRDHMKRGRQGQEGGDPAVAGCRRRAAELGRDSCGPAGKTNTPGRAELAVAPDMTSQVNGVKDAAERVHPMDSRSPGGGPGRTWARCVDSCESQIAAGRRTTTHDSLFKVIQLLLGKPGIVTLLHWGTREKRSLEMAMVDFISG